MAKRNNKSTNELSLEQLGKVPPQAKDLEEAVLGALMLDSDALSNAIEILRTESFTKPNIKKYLQQLKSFFNSAQPVDILTVTNQLRKNGELDEIGGAVFVAGLTERVASAANIETHARIIAQNTSKEN